MKTWKLVSGILSLVFTVIILFQSCAAGIVGAVEKSSSSGGSAGVLVSLCMIAGGITSIATRNSEGNGGNKALIAIFGLAALMAFTMNGIFKDLIVWGLWCAINAGLAFKDMLGKKA